MSSERSSLRGEEGYTLAAVIVAITVLSILLAAALPVWSQRIQREKEEELIARGLQYAQAIQVFQQRYGRYPNRLEELIEVKPRCIRQLFKDPMTKDGKWGLIIGGPGGASVAIPGPNGQNPSQRDRRNVVQGTSPGLERRGGNGELIPSGPISGVYSLSNEDAILSFGDAETHSQWKFDTQLLNAVAIVSADGGVPTGPAILPARWIGRPFRKGIQVQMQQPGAPPIQQGTGPDGRPVDLNQGGQELGGGDKNQGSSFGSPRGGNRSGSSFRDRSDQNRDSPQKDEDGR